MPPKLLFDISQIDFSRDLYDQQAIRAINPQRGDMEHLNGVNWADAEAGRIVGYKNVTEDEFWVPGHLPGRPLLPGVIMIEAAAQLCGFFTKQFAGWSGFVGFGGVEDVRFRRQVAPPAKLLLIAERLWMRHKRMSCRVQGIVDGIMVFEAAVTGTEM